MKRIETSAPENNYLYIYLFSDSLYRQIKSHLIRFWSV